ncbi:Phage anti-repressor protein [Serratia quinivorans]|uniref:Phage anti-repressor protein n=1 Tax=Serratia quinivorans TaxID=137545 RepID=A0A380AHE6_9GAMM|nr:antA/AntB antirepressor family protein [Serratia proteamaculans]SUI81060.1 Phage anti-repressor protein [Serratia quinivorans]
MNSQLVPVFNGTISDESALLCNARDLHRFLGVGKMFASWIKERIAEYEFVENQDYILLANFGKQTSGRGGHNRKDYHLTLDTAKELAMVERNEKGRQVRQYFIECEKRLHNHVAVTSHQKPELPKPAINAKNLLSRVREMQATWDSIRKDMSVIDPRLANHLNQSMAVLDLAAATLAKNKQKRLSK